jgi:hypothetical protein
VPFMPTPWAAAITLVLRFTISQMDVPTRMAYVQVRSHTPSSLSFASIQAFLRPPSCARLMPFLHRSHAT